MLDDIEQAFARAAERRRLLELRVAQLEQENQELRKMLQRIEPARPLPKYEHKTHVVQNLLLSINI